MSWKNLTSLFALSALMAAPVSAQPVLELLDGGLNGGNRVFNVFVTPDPTRYTVDTGSGSPDAASVAVELGLSNINPMGGAIPNVVPGSITVSADFQDDNVAPLGNPGFNPFQGGATTDGVQIEANGTDLFAALGSTGDISQPLVGLLSGRTLVMSFEVDEAISVIDFLGWNESAGSVSGAVVAQAGEIFHISLTAGIAGDYTANGNVDIVDFGTFGAAFGNPAEDFPESDFNRTGPTIDIVDFGIFGGNFGLSMPSSGALTSAAVPEPASVALIGLLGIAGLGVRQLRRK